VPFDPERLYELMIADRERNPSGYAILAISEGARPVSGSRFERGEPDVAGNRQLGGVGEFVADYFEQRSDERVIYQRLAYLMRSGPPDSLDQLVAKNFGRVAAELASGGKTGSMVAITDGRYAAVPIELTGLQRKQVDVERFYDSETFRPKATTLLGLPMFHS
jgi:ATP-dependent phosphofructokinase / diphosphate-dependent phosphofructokinase